MREKLYEMYFSEGFSLSIHENLFLFEPFSLRLHQSVKNQRPFDLEVLEGVIILVDIPQDTPFNGHFLSDLPCAGVMTDTGLAVH